MLKISLPGKDVKTARPEDLAVDSTFDTLKIIVQNTNPYTGEIQVKFAGNPANGTYTLFNYEHNLSYTPLYYMFFDLSKSSAVLGSNTSLDTGVQFSTDVFDSQYFKVVHTDKGFRFDFVVVDSAGGDNMTGTTYLFKYFVFVNDGT